MVFKLDIIEIPQNTITNKTEAQTKNIQTAMDMNGTQS